jgi:hypothetical protein
VEEYNADRNKGKSIIDLPPLLIEAFDEEHNVCHKQLQELRAGANSMWLVKLGQEVKSQFGRGVIEQPEDGARRMRSGR